MALSKLCSRCQCIILYGNRLCDRCTDKIGSYRSVSDKVYQQNRSDSKEQKVYKSATWKRIRAQAISKLMDYAKSALRKER